VLQLTLLSDWRGRFYWCVLGGNKDCSGQLDIELFRVVALIDCDAHAASRVDVEKGVTDGDIHERLCEGHGHGFLIQLDRHLVSYNVAECLEILTGDVADQGAKGIVETNDVAGDAFVVADGCLRCESNELRHNRAYQVEIPTAGQVRSSWRKD